MTGKALPKAAGRAGWHDVNTLDCGWAFVIDHPKEREGACMRVLCPRMLIYAEPGKDMWVSMPEVVSAASCTFAGKGRKDSVDPSVGP